MPAPIFCPRAVPLTVEQIVEETRTWSEDQFVLLVHRLGERRHDIDPQIEEAWRIEVHRRLEEIESGKVQPIPLEESLARARTIAGL
jgi:putative addiction module component (TIGR02574 family)